MRKSRLLPLLLMGLATAAAAQTPPPPPSIATFPANSLATVLGRSVHDASGDEIGHLVDILVDAEGRPIAGVLDVGGFLGIGTRRVALAWPTLHVDPATPDLRVNDDLTTDEVAAAPEFKGTDGPVSVLGPRPKSP